MVDNQRKPTKEELEAFAKIKEQTGYREPILISVSDNWISQQINACAEIGFVQPGDRKDGQNATDQAHWLLFAVALMELQAMRGAIPSEKRGNTILPGEQIPQDVRKALIAQLRPQPAPESKIIRPN